MIVVGSAILGWLATSLAAPVLSYEALLPKVVSSSADAPADQETTLYAATQGLALSAAAAVQDLEQVNESREWLLRDMRAGGWGAAWPLDAFSDRSLTRENTPYAMATALAINGLLDADLDDGAASDIADIVVKWADDGWTQTDIGGFYWFSLAPHDAILVPSSSAMLAGTTARMLALHRDAFTEGEHDRLAERVHDALQQIDASSRSMIWRYSSARRIPNDLRQHVSVLWGAELARDAGLAIPWSRSEAIESIDLYRSGTRLGVWPASATLTDDMRRRRISPHLSAGVGAADAFTSRWGGPSYSSELRLALASSPGRPEFTAYALLAVALRAGPDR